MTHYQMMLPLERQLLVGKIVDLLIYDPKFCTQMIEVVRLKEEAGDIKSKFFQEDKIETEK